MSDYEFTTDWFSWAPPVWEQLKPILPERKSFLEIGSFEGRSTVWTVENLIDDDGEIHCIDTWLGSEEHSEETMNGTFERFKKNIEIVNEKHPTRKVISYENDSVSALAKILCTEKEFDFIYIDGSHVASDVLTDACMAWPMLKSQGVMVFDDYAWRPRELYILHKPKIAIETFTTIFEEELEVIHTGYQLIVRKL